MFLISVYFLLSKKQKKKAKPYFLFDTSKKEKEIINLLKKESKLKLKIHQDDNLIILHH